MSFDGTQYRCDVCPSIATNLARDRYELPSTKDNIQLYSAGKVKCGCDAHPVDSETFTVDGETLRIYTGDMP